MTNRRLLPSKASTLLFFVLIVCSTLVSAQTTPETNTQQLFQLINQRLGVMHDVAVYKWQQNIAIEDLAREKRVIESTAAAAAQSGLDRASTIDFFSIQIIAAKTIQAGWHQHWRQSGFDATTVVMDLKTEIRPKLIELGKQIIHKIADALPNLHDPKQYDGLLQQFDSTIDQAYITAEIKKQLFDALIRIKPKQAMLTTQLDSIIAAGIIRIGTTGDYPPFSQLDTATNQFSGIDIELAHLLAKSLGVRAEFVQTSWPTLLQDLRDDRFDIAMSGISRKLFRQRVGFFSYPYHSGGKTPIIRCADRARFNSVSTIDEPGVRIIVNPGGTNQRFAEATIKSASISIHADNTTIFEQLLQNKADVMFTDDIEVALQTHLHSDLCAAMPGQNLTVSEKGFLMHRDIVLKEYVNAWLHEMKITGTLENVFSDHLRK